MTGDVTVILEDKRRGS